MFGFGSGVVIAGGVLFAVVAMCVASRYPHAGPNKALVVDGRGPTRILTSGIALISFDVQTVAVH